MVNYTVRVFDQIAMAGGTEAMNAVVDFQGVFAVFGP